LNARILIQKLNKYKQKQGVSEISKTLCLRGTQIENCSSSQLLRTYVTNRVYDDDDTDFSANSVLLELKFTVRIS